MNNQMYYIQHTGHFAFDYILWWGHDSKGYTYDLDRAGLYTEEQAKSICKIRGQEVAFKKEDVEACVSKSVDVHRLLERSSGQFKTTDTAIKVKNRAPNCSRCGKFFKDADPYIGTCKACRWDMQHERY